MAKTFVDETVLFIRENEMPEDTFEDDYMSDDSLLDGEFETLGGSFDPASILVR